jgi:16S rRNA C1402 N4-methylase RsmH
MCGLTPWGKMVNRKIIIATPTELGRNPRARSAKMRIFETV